jgi:hypothetical protein
MLSSKLYLGWNNENIDVRGWVIILRNFTKWADGKMDRLTDGQMKRCTNAEMKR